MSENSLIRLPNFSFGVEIETVIVFHEAAIISQLSNPNAYLIKLKEDDKLRDDLCPYGYINIQFRSWAIANDGGGPEWVVDPGATLNGAEKATNIFVRPYLEEPLRLVQSCMKRSKLPWLRNIQVYFNDRFPYVKQDLYDKWTITGEPSLQGLSQDQKKDLLSQRGPRITRSKKGDLTKMYDSWGIKLVSPVYSSKDQLCVMRSQINEIGRAMNKFGGNNQQSELMTCCTEDCGLHVHIGRKVDIGTMKHLALILIVYEDEILRLIPKYRRQLANGASGQNEMPSQIMSNRENFRWKDDEPVIRSFIDLSGDVKTEKYTFKYRPLDKIRDMIFNLTPNAELEHLQRLIGESRSKLVNFTYLNRTDLPKTIEFRQHEGTINPIAIESWVRFCLGLVELAWEMANNGHLFPAKSWDDRIWIEDLFTAMNLEQRFVKLFRRKMNTFGDDGQPRTLDHLYTKCGE